MIRKLQKTDIDTVARIWLDGNRQAHGFIPAGYWEDNLIHVKEMLLQTEVYVYEEESSRAILGFAGLEKEYIAGIFVQSDARSRGIGRMLLNYVKDRKKKLTLNVYRKNERAVRKHSTGRPPTPARTEYSRCSMPRLPAAPLYQAAFLSL